MIKQCLYCGEKFYVYDCISHLRKHCSKKCFLKNRVYPIGKDHPRFGKKHSEETKLKMRMNRVDISGSKNPNWRGGIQEYNYKVRNSDEYKNWRNAIFKRDNYICQGCGQKGCKLEVHHIKKFSQHPDLRFDLYNGTTLCHECHKKTDNYRNRGL